MEENAFCEIPMGENEQGGIEWDSRDRNILCGIVKDSKDKTGKCMGDSLSFMKRCIQPIAEHLQTWHLHTICFISCFFCVGLCYTRRGF